jgi:3-oxoacyl-[acyl-carrier-protein] synthase-3
VTRFANVKIIGTGMALPRTAVSTEQLCQVVKTDPEWVKQFVGCHERRISADGEGVSTLAAAAADNAITNATKRLTWAPDLSIVATSTPDFAAPSIASRVQAALGFDKGIAFDVNAVCGGFVYALTIAGSMIEHGLAGCAIVIGADTFSRITDFTQRDCVFFGDGAGAVVLNSCKQTDTSWMVAELGGGGMNRGAFTCATGDTFKMTGATVTETASGILPKVIRNFCIREKVRPAKYVLHQGSRVLMGKLRDALKTDDSDAPSNLHNYANTAAASVPMLLHELVVNGRIEAGEEVLIGAFGAGWVWGVAAFPWAYHV